jgi:hypothetical protein
MRRMFSRLFAIPAALALFLALAIVGYVSFEPRSAEAQTPNFPTSYGGVVVVPFHLSGQYGATTANVVRFKVPFAATLLSVQANARVSGGSSPTLTVDVLEAGTTVLSAPISITAGTVAFGTITDSALADEAEITVTLTIGGSSPTWNDITVVLVLART